MIDIMGWEEWIKLSDAEQAEIRRRHERPGSKAMPGSLSVEEQRDWFRDLTDTSHVPNTQGE